MVKSSVGEQALSMVCRGGLVLFKEFPANSHTRGKGWEARRSGGAARTHGALRDSLLDLSSPGSRVMSKQRRKKERPAYQWCRRQPYTFVAWSCARLLYRCSQFAVTWILSGFLPFSRHLSPMPPCEKQLAGISSSLSLLCSHPPSWSCKRIAR